MKDCWALDANRGPLSLLSADPSSVWTGVGFCQGHTQEQPVTECPLPPRLHARDVEEQDLRWAAYILVRLHTRSWFI